MTLKEIIKSFISINKAHYRQLKSGGDIAHLKKLAADEVYNVVHKESVPVFVLSTGRCGTKLMTEVLSDYDHFSVYHEPYPEFSWHSSYAYKHHRNRHDELRMMFDAARYELIRDAHLTGRQYVETNNRITFFAYQIAELFPRARFVHLFREPYAFIKSGIQRNWYSNAEIYDEGRIHAEDPGLWEGYSTEQKIAWLWMATNEFIEDFKSSHPERVLSVSSEKLFGDTAVWESLTTFMGQPKPDPETLAAKLKRPVNTSRQSIRLSDSAKEDIREVLSGSEFYNAHFPQ